MAERQTIAVDIDDVLAASAPGFAEYSNRRWGSNVSAADYDEDWSKFWGISLAEAVVRAEEWHNSDAVREYTSIEHARPVLNTLKERFDLVVVTSRRIVLKAATDNWLEENFPGMFSDIHYAGIWDTDGDLTEALHATKTDVCKAVGADYLIDDQLKHCIAAGNAGIGALLFGDYTWNRNDEALSDGVQRVSSWRDVEAFFAAID